MALKLFIFDLDGTLIDSGEDIALSVNELRARLDCAPLPVDEVRTFVGDGVQKLLERAFSDRPAEIVARAKGMYLPIYRRRLLDHTTPYPGVVPGLEALEESGCISTVLTNKPLRESLAILDGLGLRRYFRSVLGGDSFDRKKPDPIGVRHLLDEARMDPELALFVGDSRVDFQTSRNAGVRCALVSYGLRPEDAAALEPDWRIDDLRELLPLVGK